LTADLQDCPGVWVAGKGAYGVGGDFVFDGLGLQHGPGQSAGGAGGADGLDIDSGGCFLF